MPGKVVHAPAHQGTLFAPVVRQEPDDRSWQQYLRIDDLDRAPFEAIRRSLLLCGDACAGLALCPLSRCRPSLRRRPIGR